jgi:hypothetical protein
MERRRKPNETLNHTTTLEREARPLSNLKKVTSLFDALDWAASSSSSI